MGKLDKVSFQKLKESDLVMMYKWLNVHFVKEWYGKTGCSYEEVQNKYLPRIKGEEPVDGFLIIYEETPIGYIQTYLIRDYPDYNQVVQTDDNVAGLDLFIGEKDYIHKGLGKFILARFLNEIVFKNDNIQGCIVDPEPKNQVAIKAYEKVGFQHIKTINIPDENESKYLMGIKKTEVKLHED